MDPVLLYTAASATAAISMGAIAVLFGVARWRLEPPWRAAAAELGVDFRPAGVLRPDPGRIERDADGVLTRLEATTRALGQHHVATCVCARAAYAVGRGPVFTLMSKGSPSRSYATVRGGLVPLRLSDDFDLEFQLFAKEPPQALSAWTPRARAFALEARTALVVESDGAVVTVLLGAPRPRTPARELVAATRLATELARRGIEVFEALATDPGARYATPSGPFGGRTLPRVELELASTSVVAEPGTDGEIVLRAMRSERAPGGDGSLAVGPNGRVDFEGDAPWPPELAARVAELPGLHLSVVGPAALAWFDRPASAPEVRRAAALLALLARGPDVGGPFRSPFR